MRGSKNITGQVVTSLIGGLLFGSVLVDSATAVSLTGTDYTQNFDTLAVTGTSSTLPTDWAITESGANANTTYTAGTGSSNTGETYSFGAAGLQPAQRAIGRPGCSESWRWLLLPRRFRNRSPAHVGQRFGVVSPVGRLR